MSTDNRGKSLKEAMRIHLNAVRKRPPRRKDGGEDYRSIPVKEHSNAKSRVSRRTEKQKWKKEIAE